VSPGLANKERVVLAALFVPISNASFKKFSPPRYAEKFSIPDNNFPPGDGTDRIARNLKAFVGRIVNVSVKLFLG
jgi:hypothetical protein